jgi:hypothetical protein
MRHAPLIATKPFAGEYLRSARRTRRNLFAAVLDALHRSRRLQAQRILFQHRDLLDQGQQGVGCELNSTSTELGHVGK